MTSVVHPNKRWTTIVLHGNEDRSNWLWRRFRKKVLSWWGIALRTMNLGYSSRGNFLVWITLFKLSYLIVMIEFPCLNCLVWMFWLNCLEYEIRNKSVFKNLKELWKKIFWHAAWSKQENLCSFDRQTPERQNFEGQNLEKPKFKKFQTPKVKFPKFPNSKKSKWPRELCVDTGHSCRCENDPTNS